MVKKGITIDELTTYVKKLKLTDKETERKQLLKAMTKPSKKPKK